jgi:hypothetical protein
VGTAGRERDDERVLIDPGEPVDRILPGAGHDLGADVEQRQEMAQVAGEERHLVDADEDHAAGVGERADRRLDLLASERPGGVLDVSMVGAERGLELAVIEVEELAAAIGSLDGAVAVLLDRSLLKLGVALEPERLGEADDRRGGGVGAAGKLLCGLEGGFVEVVDDVAGDVLLRTGELVEALGDVGGEGLAVAGGVGAGLGGRLAHGRQIRFAQGFPFPRHRRRVQVARDPRRCGWIGS